MSGYFSIFQKPNVAVNQNSETLEMFIGRFLDDPSIFFELSENEQRGIDRLMDKALSAAMTAISSGSEE